MADPIATALDSDAGCRELIGGAIMGPLSCILRVVDDPMCRSLLKIGTKIMGWLLPGGLLLALSLSAAAERLPLKSYTTTDGLAHNVVNKIVRDSRGFLWFCTADGLSRFDGYTFANYGTEHGLPHPNVTNILETRG